MKYKGRILCVVLLSMLFKPIVFPYGVFNIPHVAENNWKTTITVYNMGDTSENITIYHWDDDGLLTSDNTHSVAPKNFIEILSSAFGYDGIAQVQVSDDAMIKVKLSYLYNNSESLCEFFINRDETGKKWFIPNPYQSHFAWFGLACANHGDEDAELTLFAYKNGQKVGESTLTVHPKEKAVGISSSIWTGLTYGDIDMVSIVSDIDICSPISITGNGDQSRHVFFSGMPHIKEGSNYYYYIPHVPIGAWITTLTAYNITENHGMFSLYVKDKDGNDGDDPPTYGVNGYSSVDYDTEEGILIKGGVAYIKSYDPLYFKLSYRYAGNESICDFMLNSAKSQQWLLTNTIIDWFDWFGMVFANFNTTDLEVSLTAFKNGNNVAQETHTVNPGLKKVNLVDGFFSGTTLNYNDVDMVMIETDSPMGIPISITGNDDQTRHVFFQGQNLGTDIVIPDANFKTYLLNNFDSDEDGQISYAEAAVVTQIDTPGENGSPGNITNLEGVQFFTNLVTLYANYEQVESIPDISNLTKLRTLSLGDNPIAQIPDLTALTSLENLYIPDTQIEHIANLPVSLVNFHCYSGEVVSVDLTGLVNLEDFYGSWSKISTLTGSTGLTSLLYFKGEYNNLTEVDFSGCTSLENIYVSNNVLTTINVTGCTALRVLSGDTNQVNTITGLGGCTQLSNFYFDGNSLTSVDLSGKSNLLYARFSYNNINTVNIQGASSLRELNCSGNPFNVLNLTGVDALETLYCTNTELESLDISGKTNLVTAQAYNNALTSVNVTGCTALETFYCSNNLLENIPDVTSLPAIDYYYCFGNYFGPDDCPVIQNIEAMGLTTFMYNDQADDSTLTCP